MTKMTKMTTFGTPRGTPQKLVFKEPSRMTEMTEMTEMTIFKSSGSGHENKD